MESPLPYDDQDDEIKSHFNLCTHINTNGSEDEIRALSERIQREVIAKPILARIIQDNDSMIIQSNHFLLSLTCDHGNELVHPAIKCLIEANPSALLWETDFGERMIHDIAGHPSNCRLMPWIATNYQWVLDHEICLANPAPVFDLLTGYTRRRGTTGCTAAIVQNFFEAYPRGLTQEDRCRRTPLHALIMGSTECEADLFKWMVEQRPSNVIQTDRYGETPLHIACRSLTRHLGDYSSEICKYLIEQCPESVEILDDWRRLPIHDFLEHCHHRVIKEVVVCLLRAYPESYGMVSEFTAAPSSIPFIQRIKPLLDEETELKENVAYLQDVAGVFRDAVDGTQTPSSLASSTCDAFVNWATLTSVQRLKAKMEQVLTELQNECTD